MWRVVVVVVVVVCAMSAAAAVAPTITAPATVAHSHALEFGVSFAAPVTGLAASDFTVAADDRVVVSRSLAGTGSVYALTVTIALADARPCPTSHNASAGGRFCGRYVSVAGDWEGQNNGCSPNTLASVSSAEHADFLASLVPSGAAAWCVACVLARVPSAAGRAVPCLKCKCEERWQHALAAVPQLRHRGWFCDT